MRREDDWHLYFLNLALVSARFSKDPNTGVGAVVVDRRKMVRAMGFNGFPRGIADDSRLHGSKDGKNRIIVHAEMNVLMCAARTTISLERCAMYVACTDNTGEIWGGPPCVRCAVHVIQAGITDIYAFPMKEDSSWADDLRDALRLLKEAGIRFTEVAPRN